MMGVWGSKGNNILRVYQKKSPLPDGTDSQNKKKLNLNITYVCLYKKC